MHRSPSVNRFQLTGQKTTSAVMLHIYLRNRHHLDIAKGYWVSVSVIGPLRLQRGPLRHIHSFQFPVSLLKVQYSVCVYRAFSFTVFLSVSFLSLNSTTQSSVEKEKVTLQVVIWDTLLNVILEASLTYSGGQCRVPTFWGLLYHIGGIKWNFCSFFFYLQEATYQQLQSQYHPSVK